MKLITLFDCFQVDTVLLGSEQKRNLEELIYVEKTNQYECFDLFVLYIIENVFVYNKHI